MLVKKQHGLGFYIKIEYNEVVKIYTFIKDKQYKFVKEKYLGNPYHKYDYENVESIHFRIDWMDNKIVTIEDKYIGNIEGYIVRPCWCEEVCDARDTTESK